MNCTYSIRKIAITDDIELSAAALSFAVQARTATLMSALSEALYRLLAPLGLTAAASGLVSGPKAASGNPFHFNNWPAALIAQYRQEDFMSIDPIPRWARNSGVALSWSELFSLLSPRDPGHKVLEAAARHGFTEGMAVPMRAGDNSLGLVSFGGDCPILSPAWQTCLAVVARAAFDAAERIEHSGDVGRPAAILSAREVECIVLLVRGHSDRQIGKLLGLSEPTIRFHLGNARDKFGATSRTHLAALAVAQGYVAL